MQQNMSQTRAEEDETADVPLTTLFRWQQALDVPISELLVEGEATLSKPVLQRANLVKLMKTARAILEVGGSPRVIRLTDRLIDQLTDIMPELSEVTAWPANGPRRRMEDLGRIAENPFPEHILMDATEV